MKNSLSQVDMRGSVVKCLMVGAGKDPRVTVDCTGMYWHGYKIGQALHQEMM